MAEVATIQITPCGKVFCKVGVQLERPSPTLNAAAADGALTWELIMRWWSAGFTFVRRRKLRATPALPDFQPCHPDTKFCFCGQGRPFNVYRLLVFLCEGEHVAPRLMPPAWYAQLLHGKQTQARPMHRRKVALLWLPDGATRCLQQSVP